MHHARVFLLCVVNDWLLKFAARRRSLPIVPLSHGFRSARMQLHGRYRVWNVTAAPHPKRRQRQGERQGSLPCGI